jgi:hypothetical protein
MRRVSAVFTALLAIFALGITFGAVTTLLILVKLLHYHR